MPRNLPLAALALTAIALPGLVQAEAVELPGPLVEADWLAENLDRDGLVVLDVRSKDGVDLGVFEQAHIPGSVYASYADAGWRATVDGVPGMTPPARNLEALIGNLGIDNDDAVVVVHGGVDASDFGSAARVYWTFKHLGHEEVAILDGGYRAWTEGDERTVGEGKMRVEPTTFTANVDSSVLATTEEVEAGLDDEGVVRVDARPIGQYAGEAKHDAAGRAGRLPGAVGLDQSLFVDPRTGKLKPRDEIEALVPDVLAERRGSTLVSYCNTGHWAATDWFVLSEVLDYPNVKMYDASMTGWTFDASRPIESGRAAIEALGRWVGDLG